MTAPECKAMATATAAPNSAGDQPPHLAAPVHACDCHIHIYDAEHFAPLRPAARMQHRASVAEYRLLQRRLGTHRVVIVTPAVYATDNRVTVDAVAQLGPDARGIAVIHPDIGDAELARLADEIRSELAVPVGARTGAETRAEHGYGHGI